MKGSRQALMSWISDLIKRVASSLRQTALSHLLLAGPFLGLSGVVGG